ncbi:MAG: serine/threonine protein phosphatase [Rhizobiales bacterium]|nr:serine/threonine protein phosphatase [Hyphomicrobiales bacterium]
MSVGIPTDDLTRPTPGLARVPDDSRIYAIGDLHGRADLLARMFERIDDDLARRPAERASEIYLGDYVDRGPDSRGVIALLLERATRRETLCLQGNHEAIFQSFLHDPAVLSAWRKLGGTSTLESYGVVGTEDVGPADMGRVRDELYERLPRAHLLWLQALRPCVVLGDFFFVHAGVRPGVPLNRQRIEDLLWIRQEFLEATCDFGKIIVHGHTPVAIPEVRRNRINLDTGAYLSERLA